MTPPSTFHVPLGAPLLCYSSLVKVIFSPVPNKIPFCNPKSKISVQFGTIPHKFLIVQCTAQPIWK